MSAQEPPVPPAVAADLVLDQDPDSRLSLQLSRTSFASLASLDPLKASKRGGFRAGIGLHNMARRTLGIILLLTTVLLWTASNFLASYIFADDTYSKPYFVTYINTSLFAISLLPMAFRTAHKQGYRQTRNDMLDFGKDFMKTYTWRRPVAPQMRDDERGLEQSTSSLSRLLDADGVMPGQLAVIEEQATLSIKETAVLSLEFCLLWFTANYFVAACLSYTSVASSTILTSTSSIWTLIFGALFRVEGFSYRKLIGVGASLTGIILISSIDLAGDNDDNRGKFPHKSREEMAIGDTMAFISAVMYGVYAIVMKKRIGNEDRVNMPLFFGLVGFFNVLFLWPGFVLLHVTGVETFQLPPTGKVWTIIMANSVSSFVSDYCWAYAMLLTTPLVVTVGLSMTIPLSLIGQMILSDQYSSPIYWVGAAVVLLSFVFINHESKEEDDVVAPPGFRPLEQSFHEP